MADEQAEAEALRLEYEWVLHKEVHNVLQDLHAIVTEACRRFPLQCIPGEDNLVKPEKFLLTSPKRKEKIVLAHGRSGSLSEMSRGVQQVKCMLTLMGDNICEADLTLRIHKQQSVPVKANIYPDMPWKIQQVQDAGNHLLQVQSLLDARDIRQGFQSGQQVLDLLDRLMSCLMQGRSCLALPKKKSLEELIKSHNMKAFKPSLPNDTILSFYVQAQKLVLGVYQLYVNSSQKLDIGGRYQAECLVPWLNDILALFTLALQLCQQLRDKVTVFTQYEDEQLLQREVFACHTQSAA